MFQLAHLTDGGRKAATEVFDGSIDNIHVGQLANRRRNRANELVSGDMELARVQKRNIGGKMSMAIGIQ